MAIPTFDQMLRPVLELACGGEITRQSATAAMETHFKLSEAERQARIPSGGATFVRHRVGWAMTDLKYAGLIEKIRPRTYRATAAATPLLARVEGPITIKDLESLPAFREWKSGFGSKDDTATAEQVLETTTPLESIDGALGSLEAELRAQLMDAILRQSPTFFEGLVLDVLLAMGYGGSKAEAARHLGQSGDEGIDGCINQVSVRPTTSGSGAASSRRSRSEVPHGTTTDVAFAGA
jgi:restriction system protein